METIVIDGEEWVRKTPTDSPIKIVVLQRGWVAVGRYSQEGEQCALDDASIIRVWGTTKELVDLDSGARFEPGRAAMSWTAVQS